MRILDSTKTGGGQEDNLPNRRFLRTASLKFKVHEVPESVQFIENKTRQLGGFVSYSTITNNINDSTGFPVSTDTLLQTIHYTTQGFLTLRIPDHQLDSFLSLLNPISVFLVSREVKCEDVSLQLLSNQWNNRRAVQNNRRAAADIHQYSKKPESQLNIEQWMDETGCIR